MAKIVFVLFQILIPILLLNMLIGKIVTYFSCVNSTHIKYMYSICLYSVYCTTQKGKNLFHCFGSAHTSLSYKSYSVYHCGIIPLLH
jgi:hypothetical protein